MEEKELERILDSVAEATANRLEGAAIIGLADLARVLNKEIEALKARNNLDRKPSI